MANDLFKLGTRIRISAHRVQDGANEAAQLCASEVAKALLESTPVDTGRAISNWDASLGTPSIAYRPASVPGKRGSTRAASISEALSRILEKIRGYRVGEEKAINISNGAPYIGKLNRGSSTQAPAGFVEAAVQRGRAAIRNVRILIK